MTRQLQAVLLAAVLTALLCTGCAPFASASQPQQSDLTVEVEFSPLENESAGAASKSDKSGSGKAPRRMIVRIPSSWQSAVITISRQANEVRVRHELRAVQILELLLLAATAAGGGLIFKKRYQQRQFERRLVMEQLRRDGFVVHSSKEETEGEA